MAENRANSFLQLIRRSERGRLKVYLGYGPGVGKTYQMLLEGRRLKQEGIDVVVAVVETHGRADTAALVDGLEVVPRRCVGYHGIRVEEMDAGRVIARRPQVALVDELAHTNAPGSQNGKRYEDVRDLLAAGIHVITTLNVQHLESLYNTVEKLIGVRVRERLPDSVLSDADQIVYVDLATEDLQKRLEEGKIYPRERIAAARENFFRSTNLEQLRELTARELASQIDSKRREVRQESESIAPDQVLVCLSSRGPNSARLLRFASRLAGRLNRNWYAVYVQTPSEEPTAIDAATQRLLSDTLTLAGQLGATVFTFKGEDVAETVLRFAKEYRVGHIVIGRAGHLPWWKRLVGRRSVAERLLEQARGFTIVVVDAEAGEERSTPPPASAEVAHALATPASAVNLGDLLAPERVVLWTDPVTKEESIRRLLRVIADGNPRVDADTALRFIEERESRGSTFLGEGLALPHARVPDLESPEVALGIVRGGLLGADGDGDGLPVDAILLCLSPDAEAGSHVRLLASAARLFQDAHLRQALRRAESPGAALDAVRAAESAGPQAARDGASSSSGPPRR